MGGSPNLTTCVFFFRDIHKLNRETCFDVRDFLVHACRIQMEHTACKGFKGLIPPPPPRNVFLN